MSAAFTITGRILWQGPPAPLPGDTLTLSVYGYAVVVPGGPLKAADTVQVGHADADDHDEAWSVGSRRRLTLNEDLPDTATLLVRDRDRHADLKVWYCLESSPAGEGEQ